MTNEKREFTFDEKWNQRFMEMAELIAGWSKDGSTKVGCVIIGPDKEVRSVGYNGFPRMVNDNIPERWTRPIKYEYDVHAEVNAILNAARNGTNLSQAILYVTMPPCMRCAGAIIQAGIKEVIYMEPEVQKQIPGWRDTLQLSFDMFDEASVKYKSLGVNGRAY